MVDGFSGNLLMLFYFCPSGDNQFFDRCNEWELKSMAQAMIDMGLQAVGFQYINLCVPTHIYFYPELYQFQPPQPTPVSNHCFLFLSPPSAKVTQCLILGMTVGATWFGIKMTTYSQILTVFRVVWRPWRIGCIPRASSLGCIHPW